MLDKGDNKNINFCSWNSLGVRTPRFEPGSAEETPLTREMLQLGSPSSISFSVFQSGAEFYTHLLPLEKRFH